MPDGFRGLVLGIETSCDETAVAVVECSEGGPRVVGNELASQIPEHRPYGGVVPELAARRHSAVLDPMVREVMGRTGLKVSDLALIAATSGPGLASSLLVGLNYGKGLALAAGRPWVGVNHLQGHLASPFLSGQTAPTYPHIGLVVSGGHTLLVRMDGPGVVQRLGGTRDDAAGEAFDKVAKLLGLGYPGGPEIERRAARGDRERFVFPRGLAHSGDFDFSFSGLKTSVRTRVAGLPSPLDERTVDDLCAGFQEAVISVLVDKTWAAAEANGVGLVTVSGGVSANRTLAGRFRARAEETGLRCVVAEPGLSTDNAVMIAAAGGMMFQPGALTDWARDAEPNLPVGDR